MISALEKKAVLSALRPIWPVDVLPEIRAGLANRKLVVLDDDPTGTQTVHDIPIVTRWEVATLRAELAGDSPGFYVLTNTRSLTGSEARQLIRELAENLRQAAREARASYTLVSRSDSTLRGHFPLETDELTEVCGPFDGILIVPYFEAGGRLTIDNVHYVAEGETLVPAAETPFARDEVFGYRHSDLRAWVEEKTEGRIPAGMVQTISLDELRRGPKVVAAALCALRSRSVCIANACAPRDVEVLAAATLLAEQAGRSILYRTAASFVAARLGLQAAPLLDGVTLCGGGETGGLIVVGSYVPKTTTQLERLLARADLHPIEVEVAALFTSSRRATVVSAAIDSMNAALAEGRSVAVFTSRPLITGANAEENLAIGRRISEVLVEIVRELSVRPKFLIAKGGITSSEIATRGLDVRRAWVRGALLPGVPVWRLGAESRFPDLSYVVFPGNVGGTEALVEAFDRLTRFVRK